jgi:nitrogen fixation protein FixH
MSAQSQETRQLPQRQFTGRHMLMVVFGFFGVVIAANMTLAYSALHSWTGLTVKNSYVASQNFNKRAEAARLQAASGLSGTVAVKEGIVAFRLADRSGRPVRAQTVGAVAGRTTHEGEDRALEMLSDGNGGYAAREPLAGGLWRVEITVDLGGGESWRMAERVVVSATEAGK